MVIEDKYFRLIGQTIYDKRLNKHGHISRMEIQNGLNGIYYIAYFDKFDNNCIVMLEDFIDGKLKFTVPNSGLLSDKVYDITIMDAKFIFGEKYSDDMILQFDDKKCVETQKQQDIQNKQILLKDLVSLDELSIDVFYNDFYTQKLYQKYKNGVLTKTEMLYAVVNYLCCENKRLSDENFDYFSKYEMRNNINKEIET